MFELFKDLPQWIQAIVLVLGALSTLATALHSLFALIAIKQPGAQGAADFFGSAGVHLQSWVKSLSSILGQSGGPRIPPGMQMLVAMVATSVLLGGCVGGQLSPKIADGFQIAACIAAGAADGLTPEQIVMKCGREHEAEIRDILSQHKVGAMKELAAKGKDCAR